MSKEQVSRRRFLRDAAAALGGAAAAPVLVPASALGKGGAVAPSDQITLGVIGYGGRCRRVLGHFLTFKEVRCLGVCDVRASQRRAAKTRIDTHHGTRDCKTCNDLGELLARDDIDTVLLATGDRWHTLGSILTARAGKDMYCEKPISMTIAEGRALADTMARLGTVYQAGHQRRSVDSYRFQVEAARSGMIGKLHTILCRVWTGPSRKPEAPRPVPPGFDYDTWLGPTPYHPYTNARVRGWNYFWDTGAGPIIGMGCHYTDIAQWGHDSDDTGPVAYEGEAVFNPDNFYETPISGEVRCTYTDGVKLVLRSIGTFAQRFIRFIGTKGWIQVDDQTNLVTAEPKSLLKTRGIAARSWAHTGDHIRNFLDCVRTRERTVCDAESAHRATTICHIASICLRLGSSLKWDPKAERFPGNDEANRMISRAMRAPWTL